MIKTADSKQPMFVQYKDRHNQQLTGKLLTYEITGEACVKVGKDRIWIPFSHLTKNSQKLVLDTVSPGVKQGAAFVLKDPKMMIIVTLVVILYFTSAYVRYAS